MMLTTPFGLLELRSGGCRYEPFVCDFIIDMIATLLLGFLRHGKMIVSYSIGNRQMIRTKQVSKEQEEAFWRQR